MSKIIPLISLMSLLALPGSALAGNGNGNGNGNGGNVTGQLVLDMELGIGGGQELVIREPEMCAGEATTKVKWNRNADKVSLHLKLDGVPYEPSYCFDVDPSNEYNQYPLCVEDGAWQTWFVTRLFTRTTTFYYDAASGDLIANEFDLLAGPPPGSIPVVLPVAQMMCTGFFQPNPQTLKVNYKYEFGYDQVLDFLGSPGTLVGILPFNLYDPTSVYVYYTDEILPMSEVQDFDTTVAEIENGTGGIVVSTSVEPVPKPVYLQTRDQLMIGWTQSYPDEALEPLPDVFFEDPDCGTEQVFVPFI